MGAKSISRVDAAVLQEAVDREPFQQIEAIASRSQSPTSATKSANRVTSHCEKTAALFDHLVGAGVRVARITDYLTRGNLIRNECAGAVPIFRPYPPMERLDNGARDQHSHAFHQAMLAI
jgi:hypothetical protein